METTLNQVYRYCRSHIDMFSEKEAIALDNINKYRCSLAFAFPDLYNEMYERICDWADENGYSIDYLEGVDVEDVFWAGD